MALALFLVFSHNQTKGSRQSTVWMGPFLSGAANLSWPAHYDIDLDQIKAFNQLDDTRAEDSFRFKRSTHVTPYTFNDLGYVYLIWAAKHVFPFCGDQLAIILLQCVMHIALCLVLLLPGKSLSRNWKLCFFILYAANPFILKYVVFNFYYFWQSVPALLIVFLCYGKPKKAAIVLFLAILPWAMMSRFTSVLLFPLIGYLLYKNQGPRVLILAGIYCLFVWGVFVKPSDKNVWHTAYIGVGAYKNPFGVHLNDNDAFELYEKQTGTKLVVSTGGNIYDPEVFANYRQLLKTEFFGLIKESPALYVKNATVNFMIGYSFGYFSGKPDWINYSIALAGILIFALFVKYKQWVVIVGIGLLSVSYTPYFPPIPAYMFGNYALIIGGLCAVILRMRKQKEDSILFLSFNDGSDMRINKEIRSLSRSKKVDFIGIGLSQESCFVKGDVNELRWIQGDRSSVTSQLKYFLLCYRLLFTRAYSSVHIINEPQVIVLWPVLWTQRNVVLDIFDSIFLRKNVPGNKWYLIKKLVYAPVSCVIVTDENRLTLLPDFLRSRTVIVPNYPFYFENNPLKESNGVLTLMYYGWLGENRGTETVNGLLNTTIPMKVIMAGWVADETSRQLTQHKSVEWLGTLPQEEALSITSRRADYIMCVYAPVNDNNINASPNKIFDAIQTETPVIMNPEIRVSDFVKVNKVGYIMQGYKPDNYMSLALDLIKNKNSYHFDNEFRQKYSWEKIATELMKAHQI